ncbi:TM2 domain-containing protein 1 [Colossoma macropomum]|uniref:TM2 domain-containing protein 1 n=1 Tax=Colossoma macropomum TaxID=42526 RepID=UPI0018651F23|nr:TM2 domain-containing protein 1 [Colossoma macropomum]
MTAASNMASPAWSGLSCLRSKQRAIILFFFCWTLTYSFADEADSCENLRPGQYLCNSPKIHPATQEPENCVDLVAWVECHPAPNVTCLLSNGTKYKFSGEEVGFNKSIPCRNVSTYSYKVAVALSLFLGWLGADRFYLGYPALGLLKFCTVGFCGIGSLVDFILISMQIVGPSDGSDYIVDYYGARLVRLSITNETYKRTQMSP